MKPKDILAKHVLTTLIKTQEVKRYRFARDTGYAYTQVWTFVGDKLLIDGDTGVAVLNWFGDGLDFAKDMCLEYFISIHIASNSKDNSFVYYDIDNARDVVLKIAFERLRDVYSWSGKFRQEVENHSIQKIGDEIWINMSLEDKLDAADDLLGTILGIDFTVMDPKLFFRRANVHEMINFMSDNPELFGSEPYDYQSLLEQPTTECMLYFEALKIASNLKHK